MLQYSERMQVFGVNMYIKDIYHVSTIKEVAVHLIFSLYLVYLYCIYLILLNVVILFSGDRQGKLWLPQNVAKMNNHTSEHLLQTLAINLLIQR